MLILKVFAGVTALISACITYFIQQTDQEWLLFQKDRKFWSKIGFGLLFLSSISFIGLDYLEEKEKQATDIKFRTVMTEISKDILKSSHPYAPKEIYIEYCFEESIISSIGIQKWGENNLHKVKKLIAREGNKGFEEIFGSTISIHFSKSKKFRTSFHRNTEDDIANLLIEPKQIRAVTHFGYPVTIKNTDSKETPAFCQAVLFDIPETGYNVFDTFNAISARSYYDLAGTYVFIYLKTTKDAQSFKVKSPQLKKFYILFGNGVKKFYLDKNDKFERRVFGDETGMAYRQNADIPRIEMDYKSLSTRFDLK
ncbi:MAG: hypothetical protein HWE30_00945 [Methylocystaceae bacterium]|nr:hypothetical protein [Methylocystaceae bacterium]